MSDFPQSLIPELEAASPTGGRSRLNFQRACVRIVRCLAKIWGDAPPRIKPRVGKPCPADAAELMASRVPYQPFATVEPSPTPPEDYHSGSRPIRASSAYSLGWANSN
jgi:hypothetical protein